MRKLIYLFLLLGMASGAFSQKVKRATRDTISPRRDSAFIEEELKSDPSENIPVVSLDDNDLGDASLQYVSSSLTASRDPFFSAASFSFFTARFKIRGYDPSNFSTYMNGVPLENLENGFGQNGLWGGLNGVMRNRDPELGLRPNTFTYGNIGGATQLDTRAGKQRKGTELGYSFSNRTYTHKWSVTHNTGFNKSGWAFSFSGSRRWSAEGYVPGTYYDGWSYFVGVDKKVSDKRTLSLVAFGNPSETGAERSSVSEMDSLSGGHYYNPAWGYQSGKKRNSDIVKTNQPVFILTDENKYNNNTSLVNAVSVSFGDRGKTGLDWYNAPNPYPDYYQYLPSYFAGQPIIANQIGNQILSNVNKRQINWQELYDVNRSHPDTIQNATVNGIQGQTQTGLRSSYILGESVVNTQKINYNSTFNKRFNNHFEFTAGIGYQSQNDRNYKKVDDLLGGQYFVDLFQYAITSFPSNPILAQPNLLAINKIVKVGDQYSYDYNVHINKAEAWSQGVFKFKQVDLFVAGQISNTDFWRYGNTQTALYPNSSYGKSHDQDFTNYALKGGFTYKLDGKNYFYANGSYTTKAPDFRNVFISPTTRDQVQDSITNERIASIEGGYILNTPIVKFRLRGYYTSFKNQMNVQSFYNEDYYTYTNYALRGISKVHFGSEMGLEAKIATNLTLNAAASVGRYYYNSNQSAIVINDNTAGILSKDVIYVKNFRVPNTPQEAYNLGFRYRSPKYWFVQLTGNYFDQMWASFNPIRRTASAVSNVVPYSATYYSIIDQARLAGGFTMDFLGGYSWKLPRKWFSRNSFLVFSANVYNLTNNKNIVTSGGEQLLFDFATLNLNKYPPKYSYAYGLNYSLNATLRF